MAGIEQSMSEQLVRVNVHLLHTCWPPSLANLLRTIPYSLSEKNFRESSFACFS